MFKRCVCVTILITLSLKLRTALDFFKIIFFRMLMANPAKIRYPKTNRSQT